MDADDDSPEIVNQYAVFTQHTPEEFTIEKVRASWVTPCWINASLSFRAVTANAKERYLLPLAITFPVDAFSKSAKEVQLGRQFFDFVNRLPPEAGPWKDFLWSQYRELQDVVAQPSKLFPPPMRFIEREAFKKADLSSVLRQKCEDFEIYLADDVDSSKRHIVVLRIHSTLSMYSQTESYLWFEKTVPWRLNEEDILPWFRALARRLPKKRQPAYLEHWEEKFLNACPSLLSAPLKSDTPWIERHPLSLVFGTKDQLGSVAIFRLKREHISYVVRDGCIVSVKSIVENRYETDESKLRWTFYLFAESVFHAQRLEHRLLSGVEVHFGIGDDIVGMMGQNKTSLEVLNVPLDEVRRLGTRNGMAWISYGDVHFKHKSYRSWPLDDPIPENASSLW